MDYIFTIILFALTFFFTIIAYMSKDIFFKFVSGTMFIFIGFMLLTQGVDVPGGTISYLNATTNYTIETTTFNTIQDFYTNGVGLITIILGLFFLLSSAGFLINERDEL